LGAFTKGRAHGEDALRLAEVVEHPYSLAWAYVAVGHLSLRRGALSQAIRVLERGLALSEAVNIPITIHHCHARLGAAYALSGRVPEALSLLERGLEQTVAIRRTFAYPLGAVWLGEGYVLAGRLEEAQQLGQRALEAARAQKQQGYQAEALRLLGEIAGHGAPPDVELADTHYRRALALAEALGMRPLQAHCHRGLGTLYATIGQQAQARTELSTAIEMYQSMDMTFWLPQTKTALAQVDA
jgi:tetratricopeptide (TPR) repeat protein